MTAQEFCYWLQGYAELGGERPTEAQWAQIKEHLKLVFTKVTPGVAGEETLEGGLHRIREVRGPQRMEAPEPQPWSPRIFCGTHTAPIVLRGAETAKHETT